MITQTQLDACVQQARSLSGQGQLPDYIPDLAKADPDGFALQIRSNDGQVLESGDMTLSFPLMSIIKPFLLLFVLEQLGTTAVFERVGSEPSNQPYNSLEQLEADGGRPRNPMINSGALVLASRLPGKNAQERCENLCQWLNKQAHSSLYLDRQMLESVRSFPNKRNLAIATTLANSGYLDEIETTLDTYNQMCCLSGTVADLARLGMLLVQEIIQPEHRHIVMDIMKTCGLYEASGDFANRVGLPAKSAVSGAMIAVVPGDAAIACYSPPLNSVGNSVFCWELLQLFASTPIYPRAIRL